MDLQTCKNKKKSICDAKKATRKLNMCVGMVMQIAK